MNLPKERIFASACIGVRISLHSPLHRTLRFGPNMPDCASQIDANLIGTNTPEGEACPVAPRVAGSNPVAHPKIRFRSKFPQPFRWA
jgi:hypothetical protein